MIPNVDCCISKKRFDDVTGIFAVVNYDGEYVLYAKMPEVKEKNGVSWNALCLQTGSLDYFGRDIMVLEPKKVDIKADF